jgi:hypothetical protein
MYRALAFKELRETAWIGALVFGTLLLVVLDQMGYFSFWGLLFLSESQKRQPFSPHKIPFIHNNLQLGVAIAAAAGATALGFRQMLGESVRGTWLFLLHRPISRAHVMLTKLAAGGALLLLASALPVLILALWAASPGTHASPFVWDMTAHVFRDCFAATALYLAACLCGLRPARWYGTRLLPLIPAALVMMWVYITVWWPMSGWIVVAVVDIAYLAALLDAVQSREYS